MLHLNLDDQIAAGLQRRVFLHPHDSAKLIKVLIPGHEQRYRTNFNGTMERYFPSTRVRQIKKEYREYLRVMLANPEPDFRPPISHMFGFVSTNLGLGCLTERVMEPDGSLGRTIRDRIQAKDLLDEDLALLNDTISRIYRLHIRASDMNSKNFVIGHRHDGEVLGPRECVLVDGFGDVHAIQVRSMAKWSNRMGLDDSCARLARKSKLTWNPKTRQISR